MRHRSRYLFLILTIGLIAGTLLVPSISIAQNDGLVPCEGINCSLCNLFELVNRVFKFVATRIAPLIGIIMVIWAGILFLTAGGKEERIKDARKILTNAVIGLIIVYAAYLIVATVLGIVVSNDVLQGSFNFQEEGIVIQCGN